MQRRRRAVVQQRGVRLLEVGSPRATLGDGLEELRTDLARACSAEAIEVHLREVVERERVALVCREREVVERLVVGLLDPHASNVHRAEIELRLGVAAVGGGLEVVERLPVVALDAVPVHIHVPEPVLRGRVLLAGAPAEELERGEVVLVDGDTLHVHVADGFDGRMHAHRWRMGDGGRSHTWAYMLPSCANAVGSPAAAAFE